MEEVTTTVVDQVAPILGTILAAAILALAAAGLRRLEQWLGFKTKNEHELALRSVVEDAIAFAEQKAQAAAKARGGKPILGTQKLDEAVTFAAREIQRRGLDTAAAERVTDLIEAELGHQRMAPATEEP